MGKSFRRIFPSFKWEDKWLVNQIINQPIILSRESIGFQSGVPAEEIKNSDALIKRWIQESMVGCSCLICFVGEETYTSKWVMYELELARSRKMGRFLLYLDGMRRADGSICSLGLDPYLARGLYADCNSDAYLIQEHHWINGGFEHIGEWIESACNQAGK